jgi:hypothetical protein
VGRDDALVEVGCGVVHSIAQDFFGGFTDLDKE